MSSLDRPVSTQIGNIQTKTGMSLDELSAMARDSGLTKHGELRSMFKDELGLGHGDANALVHAIQQSDGTRAAAGKSEDAVLDEIYAGAKAGFRPIHDALMREITPFGDFDVVPKKGYVSLRQEEAVRDDRAEDQHAVRGRHQREGPGARSTPPRAAEGQHVPDRRSGRRRERGGRSARRVGQGRVRLRRLKRVREPAGALVAARDGAGWQVRSSGRPHRLAA